MEQYINKAAVVAEIERRVKVNKECMLGLRNLDYYQGKVDALNDTISFLDTLEAKEVDLEKEIGIEDAVHGTIDFPLIGYDFPNIYPNYKELKEYCDRKGIKDNDKVKLIIIKDM